MHSRPPGRSIELGGCGAELGYLTVGPKSPGYALELKSHFEIRLASSHIAYLSYCQVDLGLHAQDTAGVIQHLIIAAASRNIQITRGKDQISLNIFKIVNLQSVILKILIFRNEAYKLVGYGIE